MYNKLTNFATNMVQYIVLVLFTNFQLLSASYINNYIDDAICTIDVRKDLGLKAPIILKPNHDSLTTPDLSRFIVPDKTGLISISPGASMRLACLGVANYVTVVPVFPDVPVRCDPTGLFSVFEREFNVSDLMRCQQHITHDTYQDDNGTIHVGFTLPDKTQLSLMEIHYDARIRVTNRTSSYIPSTINERQPGREAVDFNTLYYDLPIRELYEPLVQRQTFTRLLGDNETVNKYFTDSEFLTRGHLAAHSDFVYSSQQRATFYYVNTAPQWTAFNGGDWRQAEDSLRTFASKCKRGVQVYTGTSGVAALPNQDGVETELYLFYDKYGNKSIPVPKYFWKVGIDVDNNTNAIAFLGLNTPKSLPVNDDWFKGICDQNSFKKSFVSFEYENNSKNSSNKNISVNLNRLLNKSFVKMSGNMKFKTINYLVEENNVLDLEENPKVSNGKSKVVSCSLNNFHVPEFLYP